MIICVLHIIKQTCAWGTGEKNKTDMNACNILPLRTSEILICTVDLFSLVRRF